LCHAHAKLQQLVLELSWVVGHHSDRWLGGAVGERGMGRMGSPMIEVNGDKRLFGSIDEFVNVMRLQHDLYGKEGYELEGEAYLGASIHDNAGGAVEVWHCTLRFTRAGEYSGTR